MSHTTSEHEVLATLFRELDAYSPILVGTFPLGVQVASSDLDVLCCAHDLVAFERQLERLLDGFWSVPFQCSRLHTQPEASVTRFQWQGFAVEVFAQGVPVHQQAGFRHMIVEGRLLALGGDALRDRVRAEKRAGHKTEPAFARVLGLEGDPYQTLLTLEGAAQDELERLVRQAMQSPAR
ncbi:MAG: DUF4269 domain-containing protein [Myxococcales bacterium]